MEFYHPVPIKLQDGSLCSWLSLCGNNSSFIKLSCRIYTSSNGILPIHSNAFSIFFVMDKVYFYNLTQITINITLTKKKKKNHSSREIWPQGGSRRTCSGNTSGFLCLISLYFLPLTSSALFGILFCRLPDSKNFLIGSTLGKFIKDDHLLISR